MMGEEVFHPNPHPPRWVGIPRMNGTHNLARAGAAAQHNAVEVSSIIYYIHYQAIACKIVARLVLKSSTDIVLASTKSCIYCSQPQSTPATDAATHHLCQSCLASESKRRMRNGCIHVMIFTVSFCYHKDINCLH